MAKVKRTWQQLIDHAAALGFSVVYDDHAEGWVYITPARPRRPSLVLGTYHDSRASWRAAAFAAQRFSVT